MGGSKPTASSFSVEIMTLRDWDPHSEEGHVMASFRLFVYKREGLGAESLENDCITLTPNPSAISVEGRTGVGEQEGRLRMFGKHLGLNII